MRTFAIAASIVVLYFVPATVMAEPYLAIRYGYKCSQCHFNPTGGGKRNLFGTIFSQTKMPNKVVSARDVNRFLSLGRSWREDLEDAPAEGGPVESTFYSGYLTRFLSVGGDLRLNHRTTIRNANNTRSNTFATTANVYGTVELLDGALSVYADENFASGNVTSREFFGLLRGPWKSYFKAGRIMLPFGLRLQDDTAFIREFTGFNFEAQDVGLEVGLEPGPLSISAAISNGSQSTTDDNNDKQATAIASFIQRFWRIGAQTTWNNTPTAKRAAVGGFAGLNLGFIAWAKEYFEKCSLLGEVDYVRDELRTLPGDPDVGQLLVYGAVNYELLRGVNLKFAYDFADPNTSRSEDSFIRLSTGIEYTVTQFLQLRAFYRFRDDTETSLRDDESIVDFEVHLFF